MNKNFKKISCLYTVLLIFETATVSILPLNDFRIVYAAEEQVQVNVNNISLVFNGVSVNSGEYRTFPGATINVEATISYNGALPANTLLTSDSRYFSIGSHNFQEIETGKAVAELSLSVDPSAPLQEWTPLGVNFSISGTGINSVSSQNVGFLLGNKPEKLTGNIVPTDPEGRPIPGVSTKPYEGQPGDKVAVPEVEGYTPETAEITIPEGGGDVSVTYTPNKREALTGNIVPTDPEGRPIPGVPTKPYEGQHKNLKKLPKTGETENTLISIGVSIIAIMSGIFLLPLKNLRKF